MKKEKRFNNPFKAVISSLYHRYCKEEEVLNQAQDSMTSAIIAEKEAANLNPSSTKSNVLMFPQPKPSSKPASSLKSSSSTILNLKNEEELKVTGTCFKCHNELSSAKRSAQASHQRYYYVACTCGFVMKQTSQALFPTYQDRSEIKEAYRLFEQAGFTPQSYALSKDGVRISFESI